MPTMCAVRLPVCHLAKGRSFRYLPLSTKCAAAAAEVFRFHLGFMGCSCMLWDQLEYQAAAEGEREKGGEGQRCRDWLHLLGQVVVMAGQ